MSLTIIKYMMFIPSDIPEVITPQLVEEVEVLVVVNTPQPGDFGGIGFLTRS
jgi:hypothetical protein